MKNITVEYFAILRDHAGQASEYLATETATAGELFTELEERYGFPELSSVKVAINDEFSNWDAVLHEGDRIVFIPPVAGG